MSTQIPVSIHSPLSPIEEELVRVANEARAFAYAPYSSFAVGAAVRTRSGAIFRGCNIENASYGLTMCAERVALYAAVASGDRAISHIALIADQAEALSPCGACRQVFAELAPGVQIVMMAVNGTLRRTTVDKLLPFSFKHSRNA
jgi:cytidine deaminase